MTTQTAKIISIPDNKQMLTNKSTTIDNHYTSSLDQDFLSKLADDSILQEEILRRQKNILSEIAFLREENKWQEIVTLFYPLEEKEPELVSAGLDIIIRRELAFALSIIKKFDESIKEFEYCLKYEPDDFHNNAGIGFVFYNTLFSAKNKEIQLSPKEKKEFIKKAHFYLQKAQNLRPDRVTSYYREAMLYRHIQGKNKKAIPLFKTAVENWEKYTDKQKSVRHQEYKNYIKSLYNLAACLAANKQYKEALEFINRCIKADREKDYIRREHKYFALGKIQFHLEKFEEAKKSLEFASTFVSPEQGDYIFELLARTLLSLGKKQEALDTITKIPPNRRRHYVIWTLADILVSLGKKKEAKKHLIRSIERDRRSRHKGLIRLCKLAFQKKDYEQSLKWAKEADKFHLDVYNTHDADGLFWAAACYLKLNQKEKAKEVVEELSVFRPNYPFLPKLKQFLN